MNDKNILELKDISVSFDGETILDKLNLSIKDGEFVTFLGASGCGKTTTLRVIAGFISPDSGDVFFDGKRLEDIPVFLRGFGLSLLLRCKRNSDLRRIHFAELVGTNDLPAGIDQVVESVGEDFAFGHVLFGYGILQSHRTIPS